MNGRGAQVDPPRPVPAVVIRRGVGPVLRGCGLVLAAVLLHLPLGQSPGEIVVAVISRHAQRQLHMIAEIISEIETRGL